MRSTVTTAVAAAGGTVYVAEESATMADIAAVMAVLDPELAALVTAPDDDAEESLPEPLHAAKAAAIRNKTARPCAVFRIRLFLKRADCFTEQL